MEIIYVRHSKVQFRWERFYTSESFDVACKQYDNCSIESSDKLIFKNKHQVYISSLSRTKDTANLMIDDSEEKIELQLLDEIPLKSFLETNLYLPTFVWKVMGRIQWYFTSDRQPEEKKLSVKRINDFLDIIMHKGEDCIVFGHGFYFSQFIHEVKKRGFFGNMSKRIKNDEIRKFNLQIK
jgi:hypothetical protein